MAKQKKKRNKVYRGEDAASVRPTITKISASNRNKAAQWWVEKKLIARPVGIAVLVALVVVWLLFELFRLISGSV